MLTIFIVITDSENKSELVDESIRHAKEAITLDVADGNSWCMAEGSLNSLNY